jgi:hypothetical protein
MKSRIEEMHEYDTIGKKSRDFPGKTQNFVVATFLMRRHRAHESRTSSRIMRAKHQLKKIFTSYPFFLLRRAPSCDERASLRALNMLERAQSQLIARSFLRSTRS